MQTRNEDNRGRKMMSRQVIAEEIETLDLKGGREAFGSSQVLRE